MGRHKNKNRKKQKQLQRQLEREKNRITIPTTENIIDISVEDPIESNIPKNHPNQGQILACYRKLKNEKLHRTEKMSLLYTIKELKSSSTKR